ncbi:hypothetical protein Q3G72_019289 [Acer saccharum]|nr:hypothetical protein Q3G72_019289 [Acer saccharum]
MASVYPEERGSLKEATSKVRLTVRGKVGEVLWIDDKTEFKKRLDCGHLLVLAPLEANLSCEVNVTIGNVSFPVKLMEHQILATDEWINKVLGLKPWVSNLKGDSDREVFETVSPFLGKKGSYEGVRRHDRGPIEKELKCGKKAGMENRADQSNGVAQISNSYVRNSPSVQEVPETQFTNNHGIDIIVDLRNHGLEKEGHAGGREETNVEVMSEKEEKDSRQPKILQNSTTNIATGFPQLSLYKGSDKWWRAGSWNGQRWSGVLEMAFDPVTNYNFVNNQNEVSIMYGVTDPSILSRMVVNESGMPQCFTWSRREIRWIGFWSSLKEQCDY